MASKRVFLGWDRPILDLAVDTLMREHAVGPLWDLSSLLIVVPGRRPMRRLEELLAHAATAGRSPLGTVPNAGRPLALLLPRLVTMGGLPERLYDPAAACGDGCALADDTQSLLAMLHVLRTSPPDVHAALGFRVADAEAEDSFEWLEHARLLLRLRATLAAGRVSPSCVREHCAHRDGYRDTERWDAILRIESSYLGALRDAGLVDRYQAREEALARGVCRSEGPVLLLATVDLPQVARDLLDAAGADCTALIPAPEAMRDGFDDCGVLVPEFWHQQRVPIPEEILRVVDRPRDQAMAVVDAIAGLGGAYAAHEITIGAGDEAIVPAVERALALKGVATRSFVGQTPRGGRAGSLVAALRDYAAAPTTRAFAALLRHPDFEAWLTRKLAEAAEPDAAPVWRCIEHLDRYVGAHLPVRFLPDLARMDRHEEEGRPLLARAHDAVQELVAPLAGPRAPLAAWADPIATLLEQVYPVEELSMDAGMTREERRRVLDLRDEVEAVQKALQRIGALPAGEEGALSPGVSGAEALAFVLEELASGEAHPPSNPDAIEILGWLELALDDAPVLIVTGVNEGAIPQSAGVDPFLPDRLHAELGLPDSRRRYARDLFTLHLLLAGRQRLFLIAGRRDTDGDPLVPSRLLFACDAETRARRIRATLGDLEAAAVACNLLEPGERLRFSLPCSASPRQVESFSVSDFRTYLACPYAYYLSRVAGAREADEEEDEMDGGIFGTLVHDVLARFAQSKMRDADDAGAIASALGAELDAQARDRFGPSPSEAVRLQVEQARRRLDAFAEWQAARVRKGWRIRSDLAEIEFTVALNVDGRDARIRGRIDRVDVNRESGEWQVLDYKTSDTAAAPRSRHLRAGKWVDLQLPLYHLLVSKSHAPPGGITTGYVNLPADLDQVGLKPAEWKEGEMESAYAEVERVIRAVRAGEFAPAADATGWQPSCGSFCAHLCLLGSPERGRILARFPGEEVAR